MNITSLKKAFLKFIKKCPECEGLFSECLVCKNKKAKIKVKNTKFSTKEFKRDADKELLECFRTAQSIDLILQENMERNKSKFEIGNKMLSSYGANNIQVDLFKDTYDINEKFINHNMIYNYDLLKECKILAKNIKTLPSEVNDQDFMLYLSYKENLDLLINKRKQSVKQLEEMLKSIGDNLRKNIEFLRECEK